MDGPYGWALWKQDLKSLKLRTPWYQEVQDLQYSWALASRVQILKGPGPLYTLDTMLQGPGADSCHLIATRLAHGEHLYPLPDGRAGTTVSSLHHTCARCSASSVRPGSLMSPECHFLSVTQSSLTWNLVMSTYSRPESLLT